MVELGEQVCWKVPGLTQQKFEERSGRILMSILALLSWFVFCTALTSYSDVISATRSSKSAGVLEHGSAEGRVPTKKSSQTRP